MRLFWVLLCCTVCSFAQEKPVALYSGLGSWHHPIATSKPEAQKFFDQGLVLLYGFNRPEALRSFRKVLQLDPSAAMGQWGVAMALGPYVNMDQDSDVHVKESCQAVQAGLGIQGISASDRDWLNAAGARCPDYADPAKYIRAMHDLATRYADDPDAQTLYAEALLLPVRWRWYDNAGKPAPGVAEAERVLEAVLRRSPGHPGANHLYIHAVESSPNPERAIPHAQRLMAMVPAAGHMVHMPGHIWLVLGNYNAAAAVNESAVEADRRYFAQTGLMGSYYGYYLHNLQFILYARSMQGNAAETNKAIQRMAEAVQPMNQAMPEMADAVNATLDLTRLRVNRWDDVLRLPQPKPANALATAMWRYCRAIAYAAKGQATQAAAERAQFEKVRKTVDPKSLWGDNPIGPVLDLASAVLDARLESSPARAVPKWKKAVAIQDALIYDEPPAWYYPVRESLGAAMLRAGDSAGAELVFREGLRRSPNNGRLLFGLRESLKAQGKAAAVAWVQKEFDTAWKAADLPLKIEDL